jgi:Cys-tRNA(Pro)/Cys-tRNA(Cys) deacylase
VNYKQRSEFNSHGLSEFLKERKIWFKLHEFKEDVKTAVRAGKQVPFEKIVKSLVFIDSNNKPFVAILKASKKVVFKKLKKVLNVKDVRLAKPEEVLEYSGYEVGAVPPCHWKNIQKVVMDLDTSRMDVVYAGGGDTNKLIEMKIEDIIKINKPIIADIGE